MSGKSKSKSSSKKKSIITSDKGGEVWDAAMRQSKLGLTQVETENMIFYGRVQSVSGAGTIRFDVDSYEAKPDWVADQHYPDRAPHYEATHVFESVYSKEKVTWFQLNRDRETGRLDHIMVRIEGDDVDGKKQTFGYVGLQLTFRVGENAGVIYDKTPRKEEEVDE